ncbi:MAG: hypothetical protein SWX82_25880 [Cyanobacteriota bacterium]|nr:hypothetical protein [Cyanobacteriota bacterium]
MKGTGEILGDIVTPAAEPIPSSSNRLASLGQDRGKFSDRSCRLGGAAHTDYGTDAQIKCN